MGFLLTSARWDSLWLELTCLCLASACMYCAGMILNDFFDYESDKIHCPTRPLPSGLISRKSALAVGIGLCCAGIIFVWIASREQGPLAVYVSLALVLCIWLYNGVLKQTILAPVLMGLCRTFNVLLGASLGDPSHFDVSDFVDQASTAILGFSPIAWWVAIGVGVYVMGITLFARTEHDMKSVRIRLGMGLGVMIGGIAMHALLPLRFPAMASADERLLAGFFPIMIILISITIVRSSLFAIWKPTPRYVQSAVIHVVEKHDHF